jgi:hypothetical protein
LSFLQRFDITGLGPGVATKLVRTAGIDTVPKLMKASLDALVKAVGKGNGARARSAVSSTRTYGISTYGLELYSAAWCWRLKLKLFYSQPDARKVECTSGASGLVLLNTLDELKACYGKL